MKNPKGFLPWLISLSVFGIDQLAKIYSTHSLYPGQSVPVIKNIFHFTLVRNTGVAFGLFKNHGWFFAILTFLIILYIVRDGLVNQPRYSLRRKTALSLILGGAFGNLCDRIRLGYIIDFLDFRVWPVFNIADSAITIGIVLLGIELFVKSKCKNETNPKF